MTHYLINATVAKLEEKSRAARSIVTGVNPETGKKIYEIEHENIGWFVQFEGSDESNFLGFDKPDLTVGQKVLIRIEPQ
jgi:hypothetical protein